MPANTLEEHLRAGRLRFVLGDIRLPRLGLSEDDYAAVLDAHDGVVHAAASLNRRSSTRCFDVNLRGGLTVAQLARDLHERGALRRYVHVSTAAIAGKLRGQVVDEDACFEWARSDWDPYARTKKFGEHLVRELLPGASLVVVRPSIVLGDSRFGETTQFDMARAFVGLASVPVLPFEPGARLDIVPADFVADAIAALALAEDPAHDTYHLTAGQASVTFEAVADRLRADLGLRRPHYLPRAGRVCQAAVDLVSNLRHPALRPVGQGAAMLDAFWPYLEWDVVFDNARVAAETGLRPAPFTDTCAALYRFCRQGGFTYPYRPLPPILADCDAGAFAGDARGAVRSGCA
jgi:nucleoside-diphosphate-sugar epimerase